MLGMLAEIDKLQPGRKTFSDPFFSDAAGSIVGERYALLGVIIDDVDQPLSGESNCEVHGSTEKLNKGPAELPNHKFECTQCKKLLASAHLLDLHLCEAHDSFFELQAARKPMFSCFVVECPTKSWDSRERMEHCVAAHNYPANFRHYEAPKKIAANKDAMDVDQKAPKKKNKKKAPASGAQQEVALPVLGGAGRRGRGRFAPNWHQRPSSSPAQPTSIDMQDIQDALPS